MTPKDRDSFWQPFWPVILLAVIVGHGCRSSGVVLLQCDFGNGLLDVYEIREGSQSVRLMSVDPPRPGRLLATDSTYALEFSEDQPKAGYLALKISINRFTSNAAREIGRDRTIENAGEKIPLHAVQDSGKCVPMSGPKL